MSSTTSAIASRWLRDACAAIRALASPSVIPRTRTSLVEPHVVGSVHDDHQVGVGDVGAVGQQGVADDKDRDVGSLRGGLELGGPGRHQRVHDRLQAPPCRRVGEDDAGQCGPVQAPVDASDGRSEFR